VHVKRRNTVLNISLQFRLKIACRSRLDVREVTTPQGYYGHFVDVSRTDYLHHQSCDVVTVPDGQARDVRSFTLSDQIAARRLMLFKSVSYVFVCVLLTLISLRFERAWCVSATSN